MAVDVICLGEILIDFMGEREPNTKIPKTYRPYPGGAAGNIAVGTAKQGLTSGVISKIGQESFGDYLLQTLNHYHVDTSQVIRDKERKTGIVFVSLDSKGVPEYLFFRDNCASKSLHTKDIKEDYFLNGKAFYFSSMSLINQPFRSANYTAIEIAERYKIPIFFDPNIRLDLWSSPREGRREIKRVLERINILKINQEELGFLFEGEDREKILKDFFCHYPKLILLALTLGERGAILYTKRERAMIPNKRIEVIDTTGAGDAFMSALITGIVRRESEELDLQLLGEQAVASAELTICKRGVIPALPTFEEVKTYCKTRRMQLSPHRDS